MHFLLCENQCNAFVRYVAFLKKSGSNGFGSKISPKKGCILDWDSFLECDVRTAEFSVKTSY